MQYSLIVIHIGGVTEFTTNLDYFEVKEIMEKFYDAEFVVFPADSNIDLKEFDEVCDAERNAMPSFLEQ